jgi:hypothetical protein
MLLTEVVKIKWNTSNKEWYENKGYIFTKWKDEFEVKVADLPMKSNTLVNVKCDGDDCENPILNPVIWQNYMKYKKENGKYYCNKCAMKLYGTQKSLNSRLIKSKSFEQWCTENDMLYILDIWDYSLNKCKPNEIAYATKNKYYFKCPKGIHESEIKQISSITRIKNKNLDCKQCNSFEQWCYNNLSREESEEILSRWDYELNECKPSEVSHASEGVDRKGYWFKCLKHTKHHSELKNISSFTNNIKGSLNCNQCNSFAQHIVDIYGDNALELYWDYDKNIVNPWYINQLSSKNKVWIKCQEKDYHGSYNVTCTNFIANKSRCPYCTTRNGKVHPLDSLGKLLEDKGLLHLWSNKNKKSPYEYTPNSNQEVWWKCAEGKHKDYYRNMNVANDCEFRCPECSRERDESYLQEKVRLYLEALNNGEYTILHEYNCTVAPKNPKTKQLLPFDNEVKELKLIIEVMGSQHYKIEGFHKHHAKRNRTTPEQELYKQKIHDRYKRMYAKKQGYIYIEIPYWTDNRKESWKKLIDDKIKEILNKAS